ncbi:hypothetical protein BO221_30270 [Archangium sp. Cb G35]|uniref:Bax inhibitor-1/YccA family protein n=1 Tax=Archangium sp. Cb G35 TaxID=1920190 RepID=UPI0009367814|nr:Bax inhibitor-1/YccA family protein [Archangium sp. Cb G35]OJT20324.1 hypothetical protein BO221_30270 [Archangium sp. Cb G35]
MARPMVSDAAVQESRRAFMSRVYGWMFTGLAVTGMVALYVAANNLLPRIVPFFLPLMLAEFALVWVISGMTHRLSGPVAAVLFLVYSVLTGLTFSAIFYRYTEGSIANAFLMSAGAFGAMSAYATFTKKDLSPWRSFLMMGLIGIIIASIVQFFVHSPMLQFVMGCVGVLVFSGLTAYHTQKLREMHAEAGYSSSGSLSIAGALMLYLDFINLFISMLRLFGSRR